MSSTPWTSAADESTQRSSVRLSTRTVTLLVGVVVGVFILRSAFIAAQAVLGWAVASTATAVFVAPLATWLGRYIPRVAAVLLTFLVIGVGAGALVFGAVDDLDREVENLQAAARDATASLEDRDDELGEAMRDLELSTRIEVFLDEVDTRIGSGGAALAENALTLPIYFVNVILTIFLLVYGPGIVRGALSLVDDEARRRRLASTLDDAVTRARRTMAAILGQGAVVGLAVGGVAWLLDLPAPVVLGLVAGVAATIPDVGILLGVLPTVALAAGLESGRTAVVLLAVALVVQAVEALHVRPRVDRWGVEVGPSVVLIVVLLGYTLHGVGMAFFGVAYAVFLLAVIDRAPAGRLTEPAPEPA